MARAHGGIARAASEWRAGRCAVRDPQARAVGAKRHRARPNRGPYRRSRLMPARIVAATIPADREVRGPGTPVLGGWVHIGIRGRSPMPRRGLQGPGLNLDRLPHTLDEQLFEAATCWCHSCTQFRNQRPQCLFVGCGEIDPSRTREENSASPSARPARPCGEARQ